MDLEQDNLGLDKPIKLGRVSKIPKLTDDLIFDRSRGLPQVIKNYSKLSKSLKKNDRKLAEKLRGGSYSKTTAHQLRVDSEVQNLESVLQFYQLWCHGLFPRANFMDCVQMLRKYKSFRLKDYRKELINKEIHLLKVAKGIITENDDDDLYTAPENDVAAVNIPAEDPVAQIEENEDDWSFMNVSRRSNALFVDSDDEDVGIPASAPRIREDQDSDVEGVVGSIAPAESASAVPLQDSDTDPFSDDELLDELPVQITQNTQTAQEILDFPDEDDVEDDRFDDEMDIMREMGM